MDILKLVKLNPEAMVPEYKTKGAAGMDLISIEDTVIKPGEFKLIGTGISIELEDGYEAQVRPRSGLAAKFGVTVLNSPGTIDSDYRGEIKVILINHGKNEFKVNKGDRIAQLVIAKYFRPNVTIETTLSVTDRGDGGFGSTGINDNKEEDTVNISETPLGKVFMPKFIEVE